MQAAEAHNSHHNQTGICDGIGSVNAVRPNCLPRERELRASLTTDPLEAEQCNYYVAAVTRKGIRSREPNSFSFSLEKERTSRGFAIYLGNRRRKRTL